MMSQSNRSKQQQYMHERTDYNHTSLGYTKRPLAGRDTAVGARADRIIKD